MTENEIAKIVVDAAFQIHKGMGPGLKVIVELKSVEKVMPVHKKQLLTYLRLADKRLGLLINFGSELMRDGISRVVNGL